MSETEKKSLLSVRETAKELNIGVRTVYNLIKDKEIPSIRISKSIRVKIEDIEAYKLQNQ